MIANSKGKGQNTHLRTAGVVQACHNFLISQTGFQQPRFWITMVGFQGTKTSYFILLTRVLLLLFYFILSLHFTPGLQSAVCILPSVCIFSSVCSLQSAVCVLHWPPVELSKYLAARYEGLTNLNPRSSGSSSYFRHRVLTGRIKLSRRCHHVKVLPMK